MEILPLHSIQKIMSLNVFDNLTALKEEISSWKPTDSEALEIFRIRFIGTKNILKPLRALHNLRVGSGKQIN
jgi:hypothetical protein